MKLSEHTKIRMQQPYRSESPTNPYGEGLSIYSDYDG